MGDKIIIPVIDTLCSKGRHHKFIIICVGNTVTDFNNQARENTAGIHITSNKSLLFFNTVQDKFNFNSNLYRFNHYQYGAIKYSSISDYFIVLDKDKNVEF